MRAGTGHGLNLDFSLRTQFNITRRLLQDKSGIFIVCFAKPLWNLTWRRSACTFSHLVQETDEGLELPLSVSFAPGGRGANAPLTNTTQFTIQQLKQHSITALPNQDLEFSASISVGPRHDRVDSDVQLQVDAWRGRSAGGISLKNESSGV